MDFVETDEHRDLRAAVGTIAAPFGGDYYVDHARRGAECTELWHALGDAGYVGVSVPEAYGGGGGGLVELALVCEETAAAGAPMLLLLVTHAISAAVIAEYGTEEQRKEWLPGLASGREKVVFAITEPGAGSNTHQLATTAAPGGRWSGSSAARSTTSPGSTRPRRCCWSRAPAATSAATRSSRSSSSPPTRRACRRCRSRSTSCCPSPSSRCGSTTSGCRRRRWSATRAPGFRQVFHGLNPERITGAALCVGIARYALARAARYANEREVWGRPIGAHQGVAHPLAKARVETELAALMTRKAAWLHDQGLPAGEESNMAKYAAAEAAIAAVDAAMQTHGGNGVASEYGLLPYWGLARLLRIAPVNREMILNFVAQHGLGLPRSY